jgi:hypothetical protein
VTRSLLVALAVFLGAKSDAAGTLRVVATLEGPAEVSLPATIEFVAAQEGVAARRTISILIGRERQAQETLALPPGAWHVVTSSRGFWSEGVTALVTPNATTEIRIRVWPTRTIQANLVHAGSVAPPSLTMAPHFRGSPQEAEEHRVPVGVARCKVGGAEASCEVPASRLDIRLLAPGLMPEYYWDVVLTPRATVALGRFRLEAGGSVIGFARDAGGRPARAARVELHTQAGSAIQSPPRSGSQPSGALEARRERHPLETTTNARGFFQIRRVVPGEYRLIAMDTADAAAETSLDVAENRETALPDFLSLESPIALDVTVEPPVHPRGSAWTIVLTRLVPFEAVRTQTVSDSGSARLERVGRGRYILEVSSEGEKWFSEGLEVDAVPGPVTINIPVVTLQGRLRLAGKPIKATVSFGGRSAAQLIAFETDERGEFEGYLPQRDQWSVWVFSAATQPPVDRMLRAVEVEADESGLARVEIDLEDARLTGQVVDDQGRGSRAFVDLVPAGGPRDSSTTNYLSTDPEGRFDVRGLAPGAYIVTARAENGKASEPSSLMLSNDGAEVTLVVGDLVEVRARVFSRRTGHPLPGAKALAWPADQLGAKSRTYVTDPEGRFSVRVPKGTRNIILLHWADGYACHLAREPLPDGELMLEAEPVGGTLLVSLPERLRGPFGATDGDTEAVLVRHGAAWVVDRLRSVLRQRGAAPPEASSAVALPDMAPGDYAVCEVNRSALVQNVVIPFDATRCDRGSLLAGGELQLALGSDSSRP